LDIQNVRELQYRVGL